MKSRRLYLHLALALIAAGPFGGFLLGLLNPGDPDPNPIGRVFHAFLMAAQTPVHAGFPPNALGGPGATFNAWPHITIAFLLIAGVPMMFRRPGFLSSATGGSTRGKDE